MTPIVATAEINRPPEEVFAYVTDPARFPGWQQGVVSGRIDGAPVGVGSRCTTVRKIGGGTREVVTELTEYDPPWRWADHGVQGPIRAVVSVSIQQLEQGRSRITIEVDFEGHGIGRLLVPLVVRRQAEREMPDNMRRLRENLEGGASG